MLHQETWADGKSVVIKRVLGRIETHVFETEVEATNRAAIINEALSWNGTPFKNCSDIKGPQGGVDCAMLLVRSHVDTGILEPFDPRPYSPTHMLHSREERFLGWIKDELGGVEVASPRVGDCVLFRFGLCFSHGGILINSDEIVHAWLRSGFVHVSRLDETELAKQANDEPRAMKAFEVRK